MANPRSTSRPRRTGTAGVERSAPILEARLGEDRGRPAVLVGGVVQSVDPGSAAGGYWPAMLPDVRPTRALLLGLGGGTVAHLLAGRFGSIAIVGVDDDPRVLHLARSAFGPLPDGTQLVLADALSFVRGRPRVFDYVAVDLFHGDRMPRGLFARPFLRALQRTLTPRGVATFNLFRDQRTAGRMAHIGAVMAIERSVIVGMNVIVHCRA
jgi:spermidine synthase